MSQIYVFTSEEEKWRVQAISEWIAQIRRSSFYLQNGINCQIDFTDCQIKIKDKIPNFDTMIQFLTEEESEWGLCIYIDGHKMIEAFLKKFVKDIKQIKKHLCLLSVDSVFNEKLLDAFKQQDYSHFISVCSTFYAGKEDSLESQVSQKIRQLEEKKKKDWNALLEQQVKIPKSEYYEL